MSKVPVVPSENARVGHKRPIALAVGFSARALAEALSDSGFRVVAVDAFGDYDTTKNSLLTVRLRGWATPEAELSIQPHLWSSYLVGQEAGTLQEEIPVFLGGGCENWTGLHQHLRSLPGLKILGPDPAQLSALRRLELWRNAAEYAGMNFPESFPGPSQEGIGTSRSTGSSSNSDPSFLGGWLQKSLKSAGGIGVRRFGQSHDKETWAADCNRSQSYSSENLCSEKFVQREIRGKVLGATCVVEWPHSELGLERVPCLCSKSRLNEKLSGMEDKSNSQVVMPLIRYLGTTESWQSDDWDGPSEFIYRGSWGPVRLTVLQEQQICKFAQFLALRTGVTGLLQLDLIEDPLGTLWLLEVNPRWSAGMEILKRSGLTNPIVEHVKAFNFHSKHLFNAVDRQTQCPAEIEKAMRVAECEGQEHKGHTSLSSFVCRPEEHASTSPPPKEACVQGIQFGQAKSRIKYYIGKAIVYCTSEFRLNRSTILSLHQLDCSHFADIPSFDVQDQAIQKGHPLVSVFARTDTDLPEEEARLHLLNELRGFQKLVLEIDHEKIK